MDQALAAQRLSELGHDTRLSIFRLAVRSGNQGLPVGQIQTELGVTASTLTHHLHRLVAAGLIEQQRDGRILNCVAKLKALREVMEFLNSECCANLPYQQNQSPNTIPKTS